MFENIVNTLKENPRKLFLIDSFGAILSAFSLGVILVRFENYVGVSADKLYFLAGIACVFGVYSGFCYFRFPTNWRFFLKVIAILNLLYSCMTLGLCVYLYQDLMVLGLIYFLLELLILIVLVFVELKVSN